MNKLSNRGWEAGLGITVIVVLVWAIWLGRPVSVVPEVEVAAVIVPEPVPEPIIIDVEGVGCVMDPVIQFDTQTGYTLITLECDTELLYHYLPAAPAEE